MSASDNTEKEKKPNQIAQCCQSTVDNSIKIPMKSAMIMDNERLDMSDWLFSWQNKEQENLYLKAFEIKASSIKKGQNYKKNANIASRSTISKKLESFWKGNQLRIWRGFTKLSLGFLIGSQEPETLDDKSITLQLCNLWSIDFYLGL